MADDRMRRRTERDKKLLKQLQDYAREINLEHRRPDTRAMIVNKRTHRIRFENETEESVTIVIEPKAEEGSKK